MTILSWRRAVGGLWSEIGLLQFKFMLNEGLERGHYFLDVGCGCFRGGVHFINYLDSGRYYGIDKNAELIQAGINYEIPMAGIENKEISFRISEDFDFDFFNTSFDFAIAQSLFTHLNRDLTVKCLRNIKTVLNPNGRFYASFFEAKESDQEREAIQHNPGKIISYPDRDPYHYPFSFFKEEANELDFDLTYIGNWNHPRALKMIMFQNN